MRIIKLGLEMLHRIPLVGMMAICLLGVHDSGSGQIFEPEGLNLPGVFNSWSNPPNVNAFAGVQVAGGTVLPEVGLSVRRYTTLIHVAAGGGDAAGGTYAWLFTSGPSSNYYQNKWAGVNVVPNAVQTYSYNTGADNSIDLVNDTYYTIAWQDSGYVDTKAVWMPTSAPPVTFTGRTESGAGGSLKVNFTLSGSKSPEEQMFVRWSQDNFKTSTFAHAIMNGSGDGGFAEIELGKDLRPVKYYLFSTTAQHPTFATCDLMTLHYLTNGGQNYSYTPFKPAFGAFSPNPKVSPVVPSYTGQPNMAMGDFNGDGVVDIAMKSNQDDTLRVMFGNGEGTFSRMDSYLIGQRFEDLAAADYDGDGHLDLILNNMNTNQVLLFRNNGDGTFQFGTSIGVGSAPWRLAVADVNGDGFPDIFTTNDLSISTLLSNGDGTYQPNAEYTPYHHPFRGRPLVAFADMNGDGYPDMLTEGDFQDTIGVRFNNGDGAFGNLIRTNAVQPVDYAFIVTDVDGDGVPDLVTGDAYPSVASVYKGSHDGTFTYIGSYFSGKETARLLVADIDGDGAPDMVGECEDGHDSILVARNLGGGMFGPPVMYAFAPSARMILVNDFGQDGTADLCIFRGDPSQPELTMFNGLKTLTLQVQNRWNIVSSPFGTSSVARTALYPASTTNAFLYNGSYVQQDSLHPGIGYWLKFPAAASVTPSGFDFSALDTIEVKAGWNMIGSICVPVTVSSVSAIPPTMTLSNFFGFSGTYAKADTIQPGRGYWVKADQDGQLILSGMSSAIMSAKSHVHIVPTSEPPPMPPGVEQEATDLPVPKEFGLSQNYPNPFNPTTNFGFQIAEFGLTTVKVYNTLGQVVATLVNEVKVPGEYQVSFDASKLPSGFYYYELRAGTHREMRKMALLK